MHTYVKLKDNTIWILFSENHIKDTATIYPVEKGDEYNVHPYLQTITTNQIKRTDSNLFILKNIS